MLGQRSGEGGPGRGGWARTGREGVRGTGAGQGGRPAGVGAQSAEARVADLRSFCSGRALVEPLPFRLRRSRCNRGFADCAEDCAEGKGKTVREGER